MKKPFCKQKALPKKQGTILLLALVLVMVLLCVQTASAGDINVTDADAVINITPSTPPDDALDSTDAPAQEKFNDVFVHLADATLNFTPCTPSPDALDSTDASAQEKFNDVFVHLADATLNFTPCTPPDDALDSSDATPHEKFNDVLVHLADVTLNLTPCTPPDDALDSSDAAPHEKFNDVSVHLADVALNLTPSTPSPDALDSSDATPHEKFNDVSVHLADATLNFTPCTPSPDALDSTDASAQEKFNDVFVHLADATLNFTPCTPPDDALDSSDATPHEKFNDVLVHLADATLNFTPCTPPDDALDSSDAAPHEKFNDVLVHLADVTLNLTPSTPSPDALDSSDATPHEKFNDVSVHLADATLNITPCTPPDDALDSSDAAPHEEFNDVSVHLADATLTFTPSTPPDDTLDSAEAPPQVIIYDLKPEDNTITGSTDVLITWRTSANSTTVVFVKKKEEAEWTCMSGEPGINHVVLLSNLTRNTWYEFYVTSNSTRASSVSELRSLYIDNGIVFTKRNYSSTVERDYDQRIKIAIKNTDSKLHTVLVSVINPYEDLIAGFVGEGSQDQIINLTPSEVKEVTLAIHAQDADEEDYVLLLNLTNIGEEIKDYAYLNLHVRQPIINFVLEEVSTDQFTLTKKLRLRNLGDTITDFKVYVSEELEDKVILQPNIEHMRLPTGGAILFDVSPLLHENFTGISGKVIATGAGANVSLNVSFIPPEGKSVFSGNVGGALCNFTRETPRNTSIWAEQILEGVASVGIAAQYNNSCCALVMDNISIIGNMIIIDVDSLVDKDSEENLTSVHEWLTLTNLSYGNYIVKVREIELGELANQSLEMKPVGMFFEEDNLTGRLYTFRGDISNISSLVPFPLVPPPRYFNEAAFWINSTDTIILAIDMSNSGVETCKVNFSLSPENTSISINPDNYSVSIEGNSTELLLFEIETTSLQYGIYNLTYSLDYQCEYNASFTRTLPVGIYEVNQSWEDDSFVVQVQSPFNDTFSKKTWDWTNTPWGWIPMHTDYTITFSNLSQSNLLLLPRTDVISLCNGISEVVIFNEMQNYGDDFSAHWGASGSAYAGYIGGSVVSSTHGQFFEPIPFRYSATKVSREVVLPGLKYVFSGLLVTAFVPSSSVAELVMVETEGLPFAFRIFLSLGTCMGIQETAQNVVERVTGGDGGARQTTSQVKINEYPSMMAFFNPWYQLRRDSDGDGLPDLVEKSTGYDPFSPLSCPGAEASTRNGDWYCNNRPRISVPFETHIPASDQIKDPVDPYLIVRFKRGRGGWLSNVKPHNLRILFNGQEIGRLTNTIPEGYYMFYVDPALLNVESDVSRNVVSLITTHHNPGHYIVSTDMRLVFVFDNINIKVFASNQGEANQIVADKFKAAKRKPDFGVCAETVSLSNNPAVGIETAINVKLYNLGTVGMRDVLIQAFDNDVLIEEKVIPFVYLMSSQNVSFSWVPSSSGRHVIKVKVNPEQSINESDFTNNEATKEVNVAAGDEEPPVISQPTPGNWLKTKKKRPSISAKFSDDYSGINILSVKLFLDSIDMTDVANVSATEITYTSAEDLDDGLHNVTVYVEDNTGKASSLSWVFIIDTNPPASISNLSAVDKGATWILWNWNNPTDDDFDHVEIWINDTWRENVTHIWHVYNATGLNPNTTYKISARAVDDVGNINETWINESAKTLPLEEDTVPPVISNVTATNITINSAIIAWDTDEPSDSLVKYGMESGNYTLQVCNTNNVTFHNIELTGLMASTIYYFVVNSTDLAGNSNESTEYNFTTIPVIDTTPPASISNLTNTTGQTWINWTWTNPPDADFNYTMVYLNGTWQTNTSYPFYNATNLTPDTFYEIGTHTVDEAGNINQTWINQTTKTAPYPAPNITSFAPPSPVHDYEGATRTFNITIDQLVNVSWQINGMEIFNQTEVTESIYTNTSAALGTWNVSALASNQNGTAVNTWTWNVWMLGDLNHNNRLDTGDATLVLRMIVGLTPVDYLGDMNHNGMIDTGDATIILRIIVGLPV